MNQHQTNDKIPFEYKSDTIERYSLSSEPPTCELSKQDDLESKARIALRLNNSINQPMTCSTALSQTSHLNGQLSSTKLCESNYLISASNCFKIDGQHLEPNSTALGFLIINQIDVDKLSDQTSFGFHQSLSNGLSAADSPNTTLTRSNELIYNHSLNDLQFNEFSTNQQPVFLPDIAFVRNASTSTLKSTSNQMSLNQTLNQAKSEINDENKNEQLSMESKQDSITFLDQCPNSNFNSHPVKCY